MALLLRVVRHERPEFPRLLALRSWAAIRADGERKQSPTSSLDRVSRRNL